MARFENWEQEKKDRQAPVEFFIHDSEGRSMEVSEHWHDCMEFQFILEGETLHRINGHPCLLRKGMLLILTAGDVHGSSYQSGVQTRTAVLKFDEAALEAFRPDRQRFRYLDRFMDRGQAAWQPDEVQQRQLRIFSEQLRQEQQRRQKGYEFMLHGLALQLTGYLIREGMLEWRREEPAVTIGPELERIIRYVEENYMRDINLRQVAGELHMNYSYASRYFRKMTGKNFKEFLDFVRISEACRMLASDRTIAEIALACGFSCPQSMTRTCRRLLGQSPSALRKFRGQ